MGKTTIVMKFGGASVARPEQFAEIAERICVKAIAHRVVVVVSAMGDTTNQLLSLAKAIHPSPPLREQDMLLTAGERVSIALLAMALDLKHKEAISFTGSQSGIITTDVHSEARIIAVRPRRILQELDREKIVIVAGFQGVSRNGEITTLGRGGSDTTAVALGVALSASCVEFYKDVGGIYSEDPKAYPCAYKFDCLTFEQALEIAARGAKVLHPRSIRLAQKNGLPLLLCPFYGVEYRVGTSIGNGQGRSSEFPSFEEEVSS